MAREQAVRLQTGESVPVSANPPATFGDDSDVTPVLGKSGRQVSIHADSKDLVPVYSRTAHFFTYAGALEGDYNRPNSKLR